MPACDDLSRIASIAMDPSRCVQTSLQENVSDKTRDTHEMQPRAVFEDISNIVGVGALDIIQARSDMYLTECEEPFTVFEDVFDDAPQAQWIAELELVAEQEEIGLQLEQRLERRLQADLERQTSFESDFEANQEQEVDLASNAESNQHTLDAFPGMEDEQILRSDAPWIAEYSADLLRDMLRQEGMSSVLDASNLASDPEVGQLRACLLDWLVEVHTRLDLQTRTLFLSVLLLDSYLRKHAVTYKEFRLLGTVALLVASKFEETAEVFELRKDAFIHMLGNAHSKHDMLQMECTLLNTVGFDLKRPTAALFTEQLGADSWRDGRLSEDHRELTWYILELSLYSANMQQRHQPSRLSVAAMLLSSRLLEECSPWPPSVDLRSGHTRNVLEACSVELHGLLLVAPQSPFQAVRRKFTSMHRSAVARLPFF